MSGAGPASLAARLGTAARADAAASRALAIGGASPHLVARPADADEAASVVAEVGACGAALVPLGRGAHRAYGHAPRRYDLALLTDRLTRVHDYTPADMTITVEAGATIAEVAKVLASEGQWLPLEPPFPEATTVGGLVAADLAGPLAATHGRARDYVIGIAVVTAKGVRARAGGRVVKNVAGYDLMKLFVGSLGTLAVVTAVTFKVRPRPDEERVVVLGCRDVAHALATTTALCGARVAPLAVAAVADIGASGRRSQLVVRLGGVAADVAAARVRLLPLAEAEGAAVELDTAATDPAAVACVERVRDGAHAARHELVARVATLPSRLGVAAAAALAACDGAGGLCVLDPLRGVLTLGLSTAAVAATLARLAALPTHHQARLVVERWPAALAADVEVWAPLPPSLHLMRRMKAALDPAATLAPGRFLGRI